MTPEDFVALYLTGCRSGLEMWEYCESIGMDFGGFALTVHQLKQEGVKLPKWIALKGEINPEELNEIIRGNS